MKVILIADVKGLGKQGDIVNAKDGYARNYLLPKNLAVKASAENIRKNQEDNEKKEMQKEKAIKSAEELAQKINKTTLLIKAKAAEDGKLYGSITSKDICTALKENENIEVDKRKIDLQEPIRNIGNIDVKIKLHSGIFGELTIKVEPLA